MEKIFLVCVMAFEIACYSLIGALAVKNSIVYFNAGEYYLFGLCVFGAVINAAFIFNTILKSM